MKSILSLAGPAVLASLVAASAQTVSPGGEAHSLAQMAPASVGARDGITALRAAVAKEDPSRLSQSAPLLEPSAGSREPSYATAAVQTNAVSENVIATLRFSDAPNLAATSRP